MTSRHECKLFNWYHFASKRYDEWLLLFLDTSGNQVVTRFGNSCCASLFPKKMNNFKWHKKHSKVQFRRRTKTKKVAWSGPHATWRASEARIVWQAVVPVTVFNLCFGCENYRWLRIFFTVSIDSSSVVPMIFWGRWDSDPLLSLLWQRCPACMAEGSHLPSDCRQEDKTILNCFGSMLVCRMVLLLLLLLPIRSAWSARLGEHLRFATPHLHRWLSHWGTAEMFWFEAVC